jgi:raffinose/stachyose/melibiose transport system permease protein
MLPCLAVYFVFFIFPFLQTAAYSLTDWDGLTSFSFVGLSNFSKVFSDVIYRQAIGRIFIWALLSILLKVGTALLLAYVLRKPARGAGFTKAALFLPYIISSSAMCLIFTVMYDGDAGLVNSFLRAIGLGSLARYWLSDSSTAFFAVIMIPIYQAVGYFFVILYAGMKDIPEDLFEAGKIDGTNPLSEFARITLPSIWPTLVVCITLAINGAFQDFDYIFIMTYGGPGHASEVPATYMYKEFFDHHAFGYGSAAAVILFAITLISTSITRKGLGAAFRTE